ncbi:cadmium resistance transporter [Microbispora bryophytorum]|uniref:cadmium resistance transporter n=1 Tax=Microbispora bryophytorum TaxID=1460882 RepID=UPI00371065E3
MDGIAATLGTAFAVFAGTNVDDVVILTVLFLSARAKGWPHPWPIVTGQYAGIAALVLVSGVAALGLAVIPDQWVGLLGLVPLALGVRGLHRHLAVDTVSGRVARWTAESAVSSRCVHAGVAACPA